MDRNEQRQEAAEAHAGKVWQDDAGIEQKCLSMTDFYAGAKWSDENPAWVSIEDRLPDKGEDVLVTIAGSDYVMEGFYRGRNWQRKAHVFHCYKDGNLWYNITHWMPKPKAPGKEVANG